MENIKNTMKSAIKYWWTGLLVGVLSIVLGFWSIATPITTILALNILFIAGFLTSGIIDVFYAISMRKESNDWGIILASGLINLFIAFLLLSAKLDSFIILLLYVGFWFMFHSLTTIAMSIRMHKNRIKGWGYLLSLGILGLVLSFFLISNFEFATSFIVTLFAVSLMLYGIIRVIHALVLRGLQKYL